jgi:hypothetical protein
MCRYASDLRLLFKIQAGDLYSEMADKFKENVCFYQYFYCHHSLIIYTIKIISRLIYKT